MRLPLIAAVLGTACLLVACERPPMQSTQLGPAGSGMAQTDNPRLLAKAAAARPELPALPPPGPSEGPKAKDIYQNVKVLGDLSVAEFTRHMVAMTAWVSPEQGCNYCHNPQNLADDSMYTKVVARRMIEMTQHLNSTWKDRHTLGTGVTCYTCHRGQAVPSQVWFQAATPANNRVGSGLGDDAGQNHPSVALTSLPYDPFSAFIGAAADKSAEPPIRVQTTTALPTGNRASIKQAEWTYSLMAHMSESLGVNCTHCHNTQSFQSWAGPAARVNAWHGIRMARDLNTAYLEPLTATFPAHRLGPTGDVAKVNCGTCHQGQAKPLGGMPMAKDFAGLLQVAAAPMAAMTDGLPPPVAEPMRSVMYFGVGSPVLEASQSASLKGVVDHLSANPKTVAVISGYHSATGTLAANQELAKQRAFAVRDALQAAGIAAERVDLQKPQQTEANVAGEDPTARRVEVTVR